VAIPARPPHKQIRAQSGVVYPLEAPPRSVTTSWGRLVLVAPGKFVVVLRCVYPNSRSTAMASRAP